MATTAQTNWEDYALLAKEKADESQLEEAIAHYEKAIELGCDQSWVYIKLGDIYSEIGKFELALERIESAIALDEKNVWGYITAAQVLRQEGRIKEALERCEAGLEVNPGNQDLELLKDSLQEEPTGEWLEYAILAQEKAEAGEEKEAIQLYEQAMRLNPNEAWPYLKLAQLVSRDKQLGLYEKAIAVEAKNPWGYIGIVQFLLLGEENQLEEALEKCEEGLNLHPDNESLKKFKQTLLNWQNHETFVDKKALVLEPENADIKQLLEVAITPTEVNGTTPEGQLKKALVENGEQITIVSPKKYLNHLYSSSAKIILSSEDCQNSQALLETVTGLTIYQFIYNESESYGTILPLGEERDNDLVEMQGSPTFCLGFLTLSCRGKKQLKPLVNWWVSKGREETVPPQLELEAKNDVTAFQAEFWQLIYNGLRPETERLSQRLSTLHRQYLSLRSLHENVQNAFAAVEDFLSQAKLPDLQLKFENQPTQNVVTLTQNSGFVLKQLLPIGSRGLAAVDLHVGKNYSQSQGVIVIGVEIPEDRTCLAKWQVPYQHLKEGWFHLDLPSIDIGFQREIQLSFEFKTQIGPAPCLSLGMLQPIPECQAYTEQDSFQRSLAFRLWTGLPGTRRVISPYSVTTVSTDMSQAEPITSGYLGQRSLLSLQEVTPNLPTDDFPFIRVIGEGTKILLHPRKNQLTIAMLPYCFPAGASQLTATVATEHAEADVIEYAMAVVKEGMEPAAWFETGNSELAAAVSEWIALDPGTSGQLKLSIEPASTEYHHIVIATRLPSSSHHHFGWAHWLNFYIET